MSILFSMLRCLREVYPKGFRNHSRYTLQQNTWINQAQKVPKKSLISPHPLLGLWRARYCTSISNASTEQKTVPATTNESGLPPILTPITVDEVYQVVQAEGGKDFFAINTTNKTNWVKYIVVTTALSQRHCSAISHKLVDLFKDRVKAQHGLDLSVEGETNTDGWMLVDCGAVVVNVMTQEGREWWDLERLWAMKHEKYVDSDVLIEEEDPRYNKDEELYKLDPEDEVEEHEIPEVEKTLREYRS